MGILLYPYFLVVFWYRDFLPSTVVKSYEILLYVLDLLSVSLLLSTFFKPLKNEYREGLVVFSIIMGIVVKSLILLADLLVVLIVLIFLVGADLLVLFLPLILIEFIITQPNLVGLMIK